MADKLPLEELCYRVWKYSPVPVMCSKNVLLKVKTTRFLKCCILTQVPFTHQIFLKRKSVSLHITA